MCGVAASLSSDHRAAVEAMLDAIPHRGPDDRGVFSDDLTQLTIGMNRLSIIDLAQGRQPMCNEDGSVWVVCNGEIFNSPQLRKDLEQKGHKFLTSNSDVEVIPHLYEVYGEDLPNHLDGMFALIIYDRKKRILFAARDRFGIKPLYYRPTPKGIDIASELKAIISRSGVAKQLDRQSLSDYLSFQFIPAPRTPFEGIMKLAAGQRLKYSLDDGRYQVDNYWRLRIDPIDDGSPDLIEELREEIRASVSRWSLSDVPIAVSLSAGIDSAAVVGLMADKTNRPIKTYTLGFKNHSDQTEDEFKGARLTARRWKTDHTEIVLDPQEVIRDLPLMAYHLDEPYGGGLPSWYVYRAMVGNVKVCHTGTGADELFGNYGKASVFHGLRTGALRREFKNSLKKLSIDNLVYLYRFPNAYRSWMFVRDTEKRRSFFHRTDTLTGCRPSEYLIEQHYKSHPTYSIEDSITDFDFKNQLPEEFLHVTDRFSMAHGIEARVPFLDHHLVERVMRVPASLRIGKVSPKDFLKVVLKPFVEPEILTQRKLGFVLPLTRWTRNELRPAIEDAFSPTRLKRQGIFNPYLSRQVLMPHIDGIVDDTQRVWTFFMYQKWYDVFMG
jgi:asparagine synthase (glutamine-hydrolysing)